MWFLCKPHTKTAIECVTCTSTIEIWTFHIFLFNKKIVFNLNQFLYTLDIQKSSILKRKSKLIYLGCLNNKKVLTWSLFCFSIYVSPSGFTVSNKQVLLRMLPHYRWPSMCFSQMPPYPGHEKNPQSHPKEKNIHTQGEYRLQTKENSK